MTRAQPPLSGDYGIMGGDFFGNFIIMVTLNQQKFNPVTIFALIVLVCSLLINF